MGDFVFTQLSRHTLACYDDLIKELNSRFWVVETKKTYAARFSQRNEKPGETAKEFAAELKRIYAKVNEFRDNRTRQEDLVRRFLDGLRDGDACFEVEFNKEPEDINEAVYQAVSFVQTRHRNFKEHFADRQHKKYARRMSSCDGISDDDSDSPQDNEQLDYACRVPTGTEQGCKRKPKSAEERKESTEINSAS